MATYRLSFDVFSVSHAHADASEALAAAVQTLDSLGHEVTTASAQNLNPMVANVLVRFRAVDDTAAVAARKAVMDAERRFGIDGVNFTTRRGNQWVRVEGVA